MADKNTPYAQAGYKSLKPGERFGRLVVIRQSSRKYYYDCVCDCGKSCVANYYRLMNGSKTSCGCYHIETTRRANSTHGKSRTRVFRIWQGMIGRCTNQNLPHYKNYGGRGIKVCERWSNSFSAFYEDMGDPPSDMHTIERIDNNGDYTPGNCRWATAKEQARNRRSSTSFQFNENNMTLAEIAERTGMPYGLLEMRVVRYGWSVEDAVSIPPRKRRTCCLCGGKPVKQYTIEGDFVREWDSMAKAETSLGISRKRISACITGRQKTAGGYVWKSKE